MSSSSSDSNSDSDSSGVDNGRRHGSARRERPRKSSRRDSRRKSASSRKKAKKKKAKKSSSRKDDGHRKKKRRRRSRSRSPVAAAPDFDTADQALRALLEEVPQLARGDDLRTVFAALDAGESVVVGGIKDPVVSVGLGLLLQQLGMRPDAAGAYSKPVALSTISIEELCAPRIARAAKRLAAAEAKERAAATDTDARAPTAQPQPAPPPADAGAGRQQRPEHGEGSGEAPRDRGARVGPAMPTPDMLASAALQRAAYDARGGGAAEDSSDDDDVGPHAASDARARAPDAMHPSLRRAAKAKRREERAAAYQNKVAWARMRGESPPPPPEDSSSEDEAEKAVAAAMGFGHASKARESWMTELPTGRSGASALGNILSDEGPKHVTRFKKTSGVVADDDGSAWTATPAQRAMRQAEKARQKLLGTPSAAELAKPPPDLSKAARPRTASVQPRQGKTLMEQHQEALARSKGGAGGAGGAAAPAWDRERDMVAARGGNDAQTLVKQAGDLHSRFAAGGGR